MWHDAHGTGVNLPRSGLSLGPPAAAARPSCSEGRIPQAAMRRPPGSRATPRRYAGSFPGGKEP
jgi:hypothetical protein